MQVSGNGCVLLNFVIVFLGEAFLVVAINKSSECLL